MTVHSLTQLVVAISFAAAPLVLLRVRDVRRQHWFTLLGYGVISLVTWAGVLGWLGTDTVTGIQGAAGTVLALAYVRRAVTPAGKITGAVIAVAIFATALTSLLTH